MRHLYRCPTRWADLDLLGHVNNVVYVDYLQEARIDLMRHLFPPRHDDLAEGVVVVRHEVTYVAPLEFGLETVDIEVWVTEVRAATFTLAYEIFHPHADGSRRTYVRATTVLTPYVFATERPRRITAEERDALLRHAEETASGAASTSRLEPIDRTKAQRVGLHVRFSDVDVYRHVNNVKYFEYFQEARIRQMTQLADADRVDLPGVVVAQTDVDYLAPMLLRQEPYDCWAQVSRVGTKSVTIDSELVDGDRVLARSRVVLVVFDTATQTSVPLPPAARAMFEAAAAGRAVAAAR